MTTKSARFQVNSRLAKLLSQEYTSTEKALKELVDNAWDADADAVSVDLPAAMTDGSIVIADDGSGMTTEEVRRHYLAIAADRRVARGERTAKKQRLVKGRKGVGKFAGLMAAAEMALETRARGIRSSFTLRLSDLGAVEDIEKLPIQISAETCNPDEHGTRITLSGLHSGLAFPDPKRLRQVLLQEYGRETGMIVSVDGKALGVDDVDGSFNTVTLTVDQVGDAKLRFAIGETKSVSRQPGFVIRVDGKAIGKPSYFGLDDQDDFPPKLLKRLYGELDADGLRDHVTAGWDSLVENSELLALLTEQVRPLVFNAFKERYGREIQLAQARLRREVHDRLAALPEFRREYAERAIKKVLDRFFGEPPEKIEPYVFVLLEAIERSDYGAVLDHLAAAKRRDVAAIAEGLEEFGLADLANIAEQARARLSVLDHLETIALDPETLEASMHKAIERNLWIFGPEYSLFTSNKTLRRQVEDLLEKKYVGQNAAKRPDLLLNEDLHGMCLLIEFKRPSHAVNHDDYVQATTYRHELVKAINKKIRVLLVGGRRSDDFPMQNREPEVDIVTFGDAISTARRQLSWLLQSQQ